MYKKLLKYLVAFIVLTILMSCGKKADTNRNYNSATFSEFLKSINFATKPELEKMKGEYDLNFIEINDYVIEALQTDLTPFFYIVNDKFDKDGNIIEDNFDIDGDNEKREMHIKCKCLDGCVLDDVDLFFSMVMNLISINASEQDFRFVPPKADSNGVYIDYGSVFDTYSIRLYAVKESGEVLRDTYIERGTTIPIDPRYIKEN